MPSAPARCAMLVSTLTTASSASISAAVPDHSVSGASGIIGSAPRTSAIAFIAQPFLQREPCDARQLEQRRKQPRAASNAGGRSGAARAPAHASPTRSLRSPAASTRPAVSTPQSRIAVQIGGCAERRRVARRECVQAIAAGFRRRTAAALRRLRSSQQRPARLRAAGKAMRVACATTRMPRAASDVRESDELQRVADALLGGDEQRLAAQVFAIPARRNGRTGARPPNSGSRSRHSYSRHPSAYSPQASNASARFQCACAKPGVTESACR